MSLKYDVFISYSRADRKVAEGICGYLEANGLRCFIDYRDIPRAAVWARVLPDAIRSSGMMVAVYSENYNKSMQVERELSIADKCGIPVLPFRLSDTPYEGLKSYYFESINWIDAFPDPEKVFGDLLSDVLALKTDGSRWNRQDSADRPAIDVFGTTEDVPEPERNDEIDPDLEDDYNDGIDAYLNHDYSEVYDLLEESALANYREAQLYVSRLVNWNNIAFIPERAWPKLRREADAGNAFAQFLMALYHTKIEFDTNQAYEYAARSARQGSLFGRYILATLYDRGLGVEQDDSQGIEKIKELERLDFPMAMRDLGRHYLFGYTLRKNPRRAFKILERGVEMGIPECIFELGSRIVYGDKPDSGIERGRELLTRAYELGFLPALPTLSDSYLFDFSSGNVISDRATQKKSLDLLTEGVKLQDAKSMECIAFAYRYCPEPLGLKDDARVVEKWYIKAANLYNKDAACGLGTMYYFGLGVIEEDNAKAWKWFKRAAELYDGLAKYYLGEMCINGYAPASEAREDAVQYFDDSLYIGGGGAGDSAIWLYRIFAPEDFETGFPMGLDTMVDVDGCERSLDKTLQYLRRGVNYNDNRCRYLLGCALTDTSRSYSNEIEGAEMLQKAVSTINPCYEAALRLYELYSEGIGVVSDKDKAQEYLNIARENIPEETENYLKSKGVKPEKEPNLRDVYTRLASQRPVNFTELGRLGFHPYLYNPIDRSLQKKIFREYGADLEQAWKNLQKALIAVGCGVLQDITDDFLEDATLLARIWTIIVDRGARTGLPIRGLTSLSEDEMAILDVAEAAENSDWAECLLYFVDCRVSLSGLIIDADKSK